MSDILWCDEGNHPFSANDPKRERYTKEVGGRPPQYTEDVRHYDVCGPCIDSRETMRMALPEEKK